MIWISIFVPSRRLCVCVCVCFPGDQITARWQCVFALIWPLQASTQCPNWFPFALGLVVFATKYSEVQAAMALINNTWWFCSSSGRRHTKPWASHFVFRTLDTPTVLETEKRGRREMPLRICTIRPLCTGWPFSTHTKLDLPCRTSPHFTWSLNKKSQSQGEIRNLK